MSWFSPFLNTTAKIKKNNDKVPYVATKNIMFFLKKFGSLDYILFAALLGPFELFSSIWALKIMLGGSSKSCIV